MTAPEMCAYTRELFGSGPLEGTLTIESHGKAIFPKTRAIFSVRLNCVQTPGNSHVGTNKPVRPSGAGVSLQLHRKRSSKLLH